jgi:hypothetical protein
VIKDLSNECPNRRYSLCDNIRDYRHNLCAVRFAPTEEGTERDEQKEINSRYLNPLRFQVAENHYRLWLVLNQEQARSRTLSIEKPEEISAKDSTWFNGTGAFLATSVYIMACLFGYLRKVREEIPYLRLSSADDTRLVELILKLQISLVRQGGIQYVVQASIGQDMWIKDENRWVRLFDRYQYFLISG